MKLKSILWLCFIALSLNISAQTPEIMNYQAIVRDINNVAISNQGVSVKFIITEALPNGTVVYEETQSPTTNSHGLINLKIGTGTVSVGSMSTIDWSSNSYYLTTAIDPTGGTNYSLNGVSELVSVPYALHAKTVDNKDDADADPTNEIEIPVGGVDGQVLKTDGTGVYTWVDQTVDTDTQLNETQVDAFVSDNGYLTAELDADPTNEIELPTGGTNGQVLKTDGSSNYAWTTVDLSSTNEIELPTGGTNGQVLKTDGSGGYAWTTVDVSSTNEIELPTGGTNGQVLKTNGAGTYAWVNQTANTQLTETQVDNFVSDNGYLTSFTELDGDATNEIQTLSITGDQLTISGTGGNTVTVPSGSAGYKIGQQLHGGTIIFVDSTGLHGTIVANEDIGPYQYQSTTNDVNAAESYTDGQGNTDALLADGGTFPAASAADAYAPTGYTAGDWYLPSMVEFALIISNGHLLTFTSDLYWTSTQDGGGNNSGMYGIVGSGTINLTSTVPLKVRPMRKF